MSSTTTAQGSAHQILGLKPGATKDDIKRRYRQLCMKWHPDMVEPAQRKQAESMFKKITEAFSYLESECKSNPQPQTNTQAQPKTAEEGPPENAKPKSPFENYEKQQQQQQKSGSFSYGDPYSFNYKYYGKGRKPFDFGSSMSGGFQSMNQERTKYQKHQRNMQYDSKGWKPKNYHERYYRYYYYNTEGMNWAKEQPEPKIKIGKLLGVGAVVFFVTPMVGYIGWRAMASERGIWTDIQSFIFPGYDPNDPFPNGRPIW